MVESLKHLDPDTLFNFHGLFCKKRAEAPENLDVVRDLNVSDSELWLSLIIHLGELNHQQVSKMMETFLEDRSQTVSEICQKLGCQIRGDGILNHATFSYSSEDLQSIDNRPNEAFNDIYTLGSIKSVKRTFVDQGETLLEVFKATPFGQTDNDVFEKQTRRKTKSLLQPNQIIVASQRWQRNSHLLER